MTKTLTEQWRDNDLADDKLYYWRISDGQELVQNKLGMAAYRLCNDSDKIECLAPVPSYDEYKRLQEQLNEANELLKAYGTESLWESLSLSYDEANEYCKKWGVK